MIAKPPEQRFWPKVMKTDTCWLWTGAKTSAGYGNFLVSKALHKFMGAHRFSFELTGQVIPPKLILDHLCHNRACVNPAHLEVVTHRINILRGESLSAKRARATHCKHGHEFTPENTSIDCNGSRHCRACQKRMNTSLAIRRKLERQASRACSPDITKVY